MKIKLVLLLLMIFLLSGCFDYQELNSMAIVGSLGFDYNNETKEFVVDAQIYDATKTDKEEPITVYQGTGKTITEALNNVMAYSPKKLYTGYLTTIIISEEIATINLENTLDFLLNDTESNKDCDIILVKNTKPKEILEIITPLEGIPVTSILEAITVNSNYQGTSYHVSFDTFVALIYTEGIDAVLPTVSLNEDKLELNGLAIFKDKKLSGYLTEEESIGYNLVMNNIKQTNISFICDNNNYANIKITSSKSRIEVTEDLKASINFDIKAIITEVNCSIDLTKENNMKKINEQASKAIESLVNNVVETAKNKETDILGFGNYLKKNKHQYWLKNNWEKQYSKIKVSVNINLGLDKQDATINSTKEELKDGKQ